MTDRGGSMADRGSGMADRGGTMADRGGMTDRGGTMADRGGMADRGAGEEILTMTGIDITFPGVHALDRVDFTLRRQEIHSLMGENGAGKSTLIKVLTGVYKKDKKSGGSMLLHGLPFDPANPLEARRRGVNSVYQEINLCDNLTVAENIHAGRQKTRFGKIDWKHIRRASEEALGRLNISIDVSRLLGSYPVAVKQMIAIARAVDMDSKILILDEPTSSLDRPEVDRLFATIRKLRDEGLSVIFISHFLDQIYELCDCVTVLRNGKRIGAYPLKDLPRYELISKMVGKDLSRLEKRDRARDRGTNAGDPHDVFIEAKNLGKKRAVSPFNLIIRKGEILGFAGLLGSGRTESVNLLFGIDEPDSGEIRVKNRKQRFRKPKDAISRFIAFCPEDRKKNGIVFDLSIRENIVLALQGKQGIFRYIPLKKQRELAEEYIKLLGVAAPHQDVPVGNLSGGNQQKVILARWLVTAPELLILDEPTRGIDVLAKAEIMNLAMRLCDEGMSLVFISSEMEEVVRCSDRVAVMRDRRKIAEIDGADLDAEKILKAIAESEGEGEG
ncbi:MAG: sugar ABC transporter ATP-binding protein [Spirochaetaceae bacterium]|jgi:simple sugar transport system ATP-binding protein|nr:sugar ABC transporter ATP-binding protein [Spirochaetaceae bacterium]